MIKPFHLFAVFPCGLKTECRCDLRSLMRMLADMPSGTVYRVMDNNQDVTIRFYEV